MIATVIAHVIVWGTVLAVFLGLLEFLGVFDFASRLLSWDRDDKEP